MPKEKSQPGTHLARSVDERLTTHRETNNFPEIGSSLVETEIKLLEEVTKLKINQSADPCNSLNYITKTVTPIFQKYIMTQPNNSDYSTVDAPSLSTTKSLINQ